MLQSLIDVKLGLYLNRIRSTKAAAGALMYIRHPMAATRCTAVLEMYLPGAHGFLGGQIACVGTPSGARG